jgi:chromosome segregation ATPase
VLAEAVLFVVGIDSREYLSAFTSGGHRAHPADGRLDPAGSAVHHQRAMTIPVDLLLCAIGGLILGFLAGWLAARARGKHEVALAEAGAEARARLELVAAVEERSRLDATLQAERQSAAETARQVEERVAEFQARLHAQEADLKSAAADLLSLRGREGQLAAELAKERESFGERLAAYQDAEQRLERAFQALSAASLDANAQRFLDLAAARFDSLKGAAQHDLAERQHSIQAVLDPMRTALDKVEQTLAAVAAEAASARDALLVDQHMEVL